MANVVLKWLGNKLFNGTKMICSIKGNNVKVDKTNLSDLVDINTGELEEDVERALLGNHVYSTTERVCGEWIDGRNIYEKINTYESTVHFSADWTSLNTLGFNDVDVVINSRGYNTDSAVAEYSELKFDATNGLRCHDGGLDANVVVLQYLKNEGE